MVGRMIKRAALAAPLLLAGLLLWGGPGAALSGLLGIGFAVANLWLAARLIGRTADRDPQMLLLAGMAALFTALIVLTAMGLFLRRVDAISLPVLGFSLIGSHLGLVLWETATAPVEEPVSGRRSEEQNKELMHESRG